MVALELPQVGVTMTPLPLAGGRIREAQERVAIVSVACSEVAWMHAAGRARRGRRRGGAGAPGHESVRWALGGSPLSSPTTLTLEAAKRGPLSHMVRGESLQGMWENSGFFPTEGVRETREEASCTLLRTPLRGKKGRGS